MAQVTKKENLTISIREYQDNQGATKKVWKTIGEIITWDDGKQSFELWGAGGYVKGSVFEQQDKNQIQQPVQQNNYQQQQAPQQAQPNYNNGGNQGNFHQP
jgi:hypothetical protein